MPYEQRYYRIESDGRLTSLEAKGLVAAEQGVQGGGASAPHESTLSLQQQPRQAEHSPRPAVLLSPTVAPSSCSTEATLPKVTPAAAEEKEAWVYQTFERISGHYDFMNDLESFGLHRAWKHHLVKAVRALAPQQVLDVASGTGDIALALVRTNPQAQVTGFDFSESMLEVARKRANKLAHPPDNLRFVQGNALDMPFEDESFDVVTISFGLRNMSDYQRVCEEMVRVLKPGGTLLCLEASYPTAALVKPAFRLYFRHIMPAMATLITRKPAEYRWLNDSTEAFLSKPQLVYLLQSCGLSDVHYRSFAAGVAALHTGVK
ncbi:MAG: bifunctional demethylmenaquinone methyltransferase/2-methoxy-6-polyprenyl-1,4-benzoquinol methylase UbiE [Coriobacteriales bacterium]|nr:bifunctional demethylmenaquinone methyltransferase/2-methoxy-6-polyprenyl-1,4-benzoquinol methylase UbiE [Coriobacteriales bacterium]